MKEKGKIKNKKKVRYLLDKNKDSLNKPKSNKYKINKNIFEKTNLKSRIVYFLLIIIVIQFILIIFLFVRNLKFSNAESSNNNDDDNIQEKFEDIDANNFVPIKNTFAEVILTEPEEQKFMNGIIRKYKPKKVLEIGVFSGGTSVLIMNAIKDIPNSKLYSVDKETRWQRNRSKKIGWFVGEKHPELMDKWTLYTGKNTAEVIETIGNNIDLVYIDTVHYTPGEMINLLEILPFLKEEAIIIIHDVFLMFVKNANFGRGPIINYSNNQLLCYIRGKLILPSYGDKFFSRNIGAIKLEKNQKKYYKQYFMALGNQWQYLPEDKDLSIFREFFMKYYGKNFVEMYDDAVEKNKFRFIQQPQN